MRLKDVEKRLGALEAENAAIKERAGDLLGRVVALGRRAVGIEDSLYRYVRAFQETLDAAIKEKVGRHNTALQIVERVGELEARLGKGVSDWRGPDSPRAAMMDVKGEY